MRAGFDRPGRAVALFLFLAACSSDTTNGARDMAGGGGGDLAGTTSDMARGGDGGGGGNTVSGSAGGMPFGAALTGWFIGHPDTTDPQGRPTSTAIYLFNRAVTCNDAQVMFDQMAWDTRLPANTQVVEAKAFGPRTPATPPTAPGDYKVTNSLNPAPGEAAINYSLTKGNGAASGETIGNSGKMTIATIDAARVTGTFTVGFPTGDSLSGTFDVGKCDIGVEP